MDALTAGTTAVFVGILVYLVAVYIRIHLERRQKNTEIEQTKQNERDTISFTTHQLRSPVTSVRGYASFLLEGEYGPLEKDAHKAVRVISRSSEQLADLINEFRNLEQFETTGPEIQSEETDTRAFLEEIVEELTPHAREHKHRIELDAPGDAPRIHLDRAQLRQVLHNLAENAFSYTPEGSTVRICLSINGTMVCFRVIDDGPGIPDDEREHIFEKYQRGRHGQKAGSGSGLGLYIARRIAEAHGGTIHAQNSDTGGAEFVVELPQNK